MPDVGTIARAEGRPGVAPRHDRALYVWLPAEFRRLGWSAGAIEAARLAEIAWRSRQVRAWWRRSGRQQEDWT